MAEALRAAEAPAVLALAVGPNPAAPGAAVVLTLAEASDVAVVVYDLLGRAVATPMQGARAAGVHRAALAVAALAPGVYVVRAAAGARTVTARLVVAR